MKYLVTRLCITHYGGHVFSPAMDCEVFDYYFSALKWMLVEIKFDRRLGRRVALKWAESRFCPGRRVMLHVIVSNGNSFTHYYVAKIHNNGSFSY